MGRCRLQVICQRGTEAQKGQALQLMPIRKTGNLMLCVLLIGNTAVRHLIQIASFC